MQKRNSMGLGGMDKDLGKRPPSSENSFLGEAIFGQGLKA
jgi:hypothetical protein